MHIEKSQSLSQVTVPQYGARRQYVVGCMTYFLSRADSSRSISSLLMYDFPRVLSTMAVVAALFAIVVAAIAIETARRVRTLATLIREP